MGYARGDSFESVFVRDVPDSPSLLMRATWEAAAQGAHADTTAALLNASNPDVVYPYSASQATALPAGRRLWRVRGNQADVAGRTRLAARSAERSAPRHAGARAVAAWPPRCVLAKPGGDRRDDRQRVRPVVGVVVAILVTIAVSILRPGPDFTRACQASHPSYHAFVHTLFRGACPDSA